MSTQGGRWSKKAPSIVNLVYEGPQVELTGTPKNNSLGKSSM